MLGEALFDRADVPFLKKVLDAAALRQRSISNNIANVNTPGYRRTDVVFAEQLTDAMNKGETELMTTHSAHIKGTRNPLQDFEPRIIEVQDDSKSSGLNNVDIDTEMGELAKNQLLFTFAARLLSKKFQGLHNVITGGRG